MIPSFTFVVLGDLHLSLADASFRPDGGDDAIWTTGEGLHERAPCTPADLDELLEEVLHEASDATLLVSVGDVTNTGTDAEFEAYRTAIDALPLPVLTIPGNHDHASIDTTDLPAIVAGEIQTPFERHIGERWGALEHAGVHFVWIDWTTWHLGVDRERQADWLHWHLAGLDDGAPVVMLTHDQMGAGFFSALPRPVVASFSGHWHTTRVADVGGVVHTNTGPAVFGGLDYCPAHYRVCSWTGAGIEQRVIVRGAPSVRTAGMAPTRPVRRAGHRWIRSLSGAGFRAAPVLAGDVVVCATRDEVRPRGYLEAVETATGERAWSVQTDTAIKSSPLVVGDTVIAASVAGEVVCVDASTGAEHWRTSIHPDPLVLWLHLDPATDGQRVFLGDTGWFGALHATDGSVAWMRDDLGRRENIVCHAHPAVVGSRLVVSFAAQVPDLWAIQTTDGATVWPTDVPAASVYRIPDTAAHLQRSPVAGLAADPGGQDVYIVRLGSRLDRVRASTGQIVWTTAFRGWFNPATPLVTDDAVIACEGMGTVWCWSRGDGALRWRTTIAEDAPVRVGPYRTRGGALLASPTVTQAGLLLVPTGDGRVVTLDPEDGSVKTTVDVGVPVFAPVVADGDRAYVLGADGALRALALSG